MGYNSRQKQKDSKKIIKSISTFIIEIIIVIVLGYCVVEFGFQTTIVVGPSMRPTLKNNDTILIDKFIYNTSAPNRYDIIVYESRKSDSNHYYIKRVIGLPGEIIQIKNGKVYINGEILEHTPFSESIVTAGLALDEIVLDEDEYFVMGDNCNNSEDSRFANVGNIDIDDIVGKVIYRILPKNTRGKI